MSGRERVEVMEVAKQGEAERCRRAVLGLSYRQAKRVRDGIEVGSGAAGTSGERTVPFSENPGDRKL
jgi:hypothetical protein